MQGKQGAIRCILTRPSLKSKVFFGEKAIGFKPIFRLNYLKVFINDKYIFRRKIELSEVFCVFVFLP